MKKTEDELMMRLWKIKEELSKEMEGMSFEEVKKWLENGKKSCLEKARKYREKELTNGHDPRGHN